ncbi:MAG: hypothetical protein ACFFD1_01010 [Candidatus Thorarchaeota archaeon]
MSLTDLIYNHRDAVARIFKEWPAPAVRRSPNFNYCEHSDPTDYLEVGLTFELLVRSTVARYFPTLSSPFWLADRAAETLKEVLGYDDYLLTRYSVMQWIEKGETIPDEKVIHELRRIARMESAGRAHGDGYLQHKLLTEAVERRFSPKVTTDIERLARSSRVLADLVAKMGTGQVEAVCGLTFGSASMAVEGADTDMVLLSPDGQKVTLVDVVVSNLGKPKVWAKTWLKLLGYAVLWQASGGFTAQAEVPVRYCEVRPTHIALWSVRHDRFIEAPMPTLSEQAIEDFFTLARLAYEPDDYDYEYMGPEPYDIGDK